MPDPKQEINQSIRMPVFLCVGWGITAWLIASIPWSGYLPFGLALISTLTTVFVVGRHLVSARRLDTAAVAFASMFILLSLIRPALLCLSIGQYFFDNNDSALDCPAVASVLLAIVGVFEDPAVPSLIGAIALTKVTYDFRRKHDLAA